MWGNHEWIKKKKMAMRKILAVSSCIFNLTCTWCSDLFNWPISQKGGFFQKNNYFFSTYMYQSDSKTSMISRVNICTTCINIFKTYNRIQCCIYSISFMNLFLIIHKTMFTCWTNILYIPALIIFLGWK